MTPYRTRSEIASNIAGVAGAILAVVSWVFILIFACSLGGCSAKPQETYMSLVFHVGGTLQNPEIYPEFSRNDKYLGVRDFAEATAERERYMRHLSVTIESVDRQSTASGRVHEHSRTETRTTLRETR